MEDTASEDQVRETRCLRMRLEDTACADAARGHGVRGCSSRTRHPRMRRGGHGVRGRGHRDTVSESPAGGKGGGGYGHEDMVR